jgi:hypothetical protein
MARQHGITADTYENFIIDSGAAYTGFTDFTSMGTLLGATRGGNSFTIEQEVREMEADGAHGPVKGSRRIVRVTAKLTINFLEHKLDNLKRLLVGSSSAAFNVDWDAITRDMSIQASDYLSDITLVGEVSGKGPCAFKIDNVIADSNFELSLTDKEEGVIAATFTAHQDPADLESEPWTIYWPNV